MEPAPFAGVKPKLRLWQWIVLSAMAALCVICLGYFSFASLHTRMYYIPNESMEPTLMGHDAGSGPDGVVRPESLHDHILVDTSAYGSVPPRRGDIVVFRAPKSADKASAMQGREPEENVLTKRVIGIPGDTILLKSGAVYRNGEKLEEYNNPKLPYTIMEPMRADLESGFDYGVPCSDSVKKTCGPARIGPGQLWVMGDNRNDSNDSRYWGTLEVTRVIGRVTDIVWPMSRRRSFE